MDAIEWAKQVAWRQHQNPRQGIPYDHAAILKYRKVSPEDFEGLPSDEECRKALAGDKQPKRTGK